MNVTFFGFTLYTDLPVGQCRFRSELCKPDVKTHVTYVRCVPCLPFWSDILLDAHGAELSWN